MPTLPEALRAYGLSDATLTLLHDQANTVYRVEHQGQSFLLREHGIAGIGAEEVTAELQFLRWLQGRVPFQVQNPVLTQNNEWVSSSNGHIVSLLTYINGEVFYDGNLQPEGVRAVGEMMAQLHVAARKFSPPPNWPRPILDHEHLIGTAEGAGAHGWRTANPRQKRLLEEAKALTIAAEKELGQSAATFGPIHGDLHFKNIIRGATGQLHPIDFDDMGHGYFVFDLAVAAAKMVRIEGFERLRDALLEGYSSVAPTNEIGLHLLPIWMATRTASLALWLLDAPHTRPALRQKAANSLSPLSDRLEYQLDHL